MARALAQVVARRAIGIAVDEHGRDDARIIAGEALRVLGARADPHGHEPIGDARPLEELHGLDTLGDRALFDDELVASGRALAEPRVVEAQHRQASRREAPCQRHIEAIGTDAVEEPRVQQEHGGPPRCFVTYRLRQYPRQ